MWEAISWICCSRSLCWSSVFRWCCVGPLLLCPSDRVVPSDPMSCCVPWTLGSFTFLDRSPGSMISSVSRLLSSSLFGIRPGACVRCSVPCALGSLILLDRSPRSRSAVFCTCCRCRSSEFDLALACASASLARSGSRFSSIVSVSVPQSFAGSNSSSLRASSEISRASFFCYLQITRTGQGNVLLITGPYLWRILSILGSASSKCRLAALLLR